jgi:hypothetical protein
MVRMISFAGKGVDGSKARRDIEETLSRLNPQLSTLSKAGRDIKETLSRFRV